MEDMFRIGVIASTHGLKGEVKVFPTTDDVNRFKKLKKCYIRTKSGDLEVEKATCKFFKNMAIISFKGFEDINLIEKYKGCDIYVDRENAVALEEDEYYIADVIGSKIVDESCSEIGVLKDVMQTGANDVYIVTTEDKKEVLIPAIKECVVDKNLKDKIITVHLIKGLVD